MVSEEEKTRPSTEETEHPRKTPSKKREGKSMDEATGKLEKENGATTFLPLSIGKYFDDLWWEPLDVEPVLYQPGKRANGVGNLLVMRVRLFWNCGAVTMDPLHEVRAIREFRITPHELLLIGYLRCRFMKDMSNQKKDMSFEEWHEFVQKKYKKDDDTPVTFAKRVMDGILKQEPPKLPGNFSLFFQKKPLTVFSDIDSYISVQNRNVVKGKAEKADFEYEIRISIFQVATPEKKEI